ncbi:MAG: TrkA family potassium uptake protein [Candidatus Caenarcaniphilales bacterium]|nr:TrkA family potassium uptake protein [Candidatus Caenarcaniphilales bacterium]
MEFEKKNYLVVGLGRFGSNVAAAFYNNGHDVLAVDRDINVVQNVIDQKLLENAMQIDGIDLNSLQRLNLDRFEAVIVSVGTSIEDSLLICATLKELGVSKVVAKASSQMHGRILEKIGVDLIVYPEAEMGRRVANQLMGLNFLDEFPLTENFSISEISLPKIYNDKTLSESKIRSDYHLNILAIRRAGGHFSISPSPATTFQDADHILVIGTHDDIENFKELNA